MFMLCRRKNGEKYSTEVVNTSKSREEFDKLVARLMFLTIHYKYFVVEK